MHSSFVLLLKQQLRLRSRPIELHLYAFDLLTLRGANLTHEPLEERRELLRTKVIPYEI
jgi:ATP-dependent DNA ligase